MARLDLRMRVWDRVLRRVASVASKTEAEIARLQSRTVPHNVLTSWVFGGLVPGVLSADRRVPAGDGEAGVRIYRSEGAPTAPRPLLLYFHGGGFVLGDLNQGDWIAGSAAARVGAVVVSVDYRLAPAHPFPAAVEDCYAVLEWAAEHAAELGAGGPIGVMGESAGGNLAAVMALLARDRGGPEIAHQALIYPATDLIDEPFPPMGGRDLPVISYADMRAFRRHYLGDADPNDPRVSPAAAPDHTGLPPALIQVAEHDPLRADGLRYAERLRAAGVPVRLTEYVGMPHGYLNFPGLCRSANQAMAEITAEQAAALTAAGAR